MESQIKSRQRVSDFGEVKTSEREVNAMLDLVKQETERVDSRFLDIKTPRLIQFNYSSADFAACRVIFVLQGNLCRQQHKLHTMG